MPQIDFLAFATDPLANVLDQASYEALAAIAVGYQAGLAASNQLNKTWRQSSVMTAVMAQFIAAQTGLDVLDDGNLATLLTNFTNAVKISAGTPPARIVTASTPLAIANTDNAILLKRTVAPAATTITLPAAAHGQEFEIADGAKNFGVFNVTVTPPAGDDISGDPQFVCNVNKGVYGFRRYISGGVGTWSVRS